MPPTALPLRLDVGQASRLQPLPSSPSGAKTAARRETLNSSSHGRSSRAQVERSNVEDFLNRNAPHFGLSRSTIRSPSLRFVETYRACITGEHPKLGRQAIHGAHS